MHSFDENNSGNSNAFILLKGEKFCKHRANALSQNQLHVSDGV